MYKRVTQSWRKHLDFMVLDVICLQTAYFIAYVMRHGMLNPYANRVYRNVALIMMLMDIIVTVLSDTLKNVLKRGFYMEIRETCRNVIFVTVGTTFCLFLTQDAGSYSRQVLLITALLWLLLTCVVRLVWKTMIRKLPWEMGRRSLLIVVTENMLDETLASIRGSSYSVFHLAGLAVIDRDMVGETFEGIPVVANRDSVAEFVCREWVDEILINIPEGEPYPHDLVDRFTVMGVVIHLKLAKSNQLLGQKRFVERFGSYTVLTASINYATPMPLFCKRCMDVLGGVVGCLITLLLLLFLGPMIYKESPGPIFFSQTRIGKNGKKFKIYKFRSMYMDAEARKKELMSDNRMSDGMMFKLEEDPRIIGSRILPDGTYKKGIGNFIRDYSLDEFPQFFNVLKGDMSLVGTRPPTEDEWVKYDLHHRIRLATRPGITGMWQVSGRSRITDFEEIVRLDARYISEWSLGLDIQILLRTVLVVLNKDGSM
ncbi:MAG: sugar transferase [Clostridiales bacterium]|nr:sugar transferase [Clostridiales bacterium]